MGKSGRETGCGIDPEDIFGCTDLEVQWDIIGDLKNIAERMSQKFGWEACTEMKNVYCQHIISLLTHLKSAMYKHEMVLFLSSYCLWESSSPSAVKWQLSLRSYLDHSVLLMNKTISPRTKVRQGHSVTVMEWNKNDTLSNHRWTQTNATLSRKQKWPTKISSPC